ncbi:MAG: hypothetical protein ACYTGN_06060 [Planctomycetota bacterium]
MRPVLLLLFAALAAAQFPSVTIRVAASAGQVIPRAKGGGGFQRTLRFTATGGEALHWIRQELQVRGSVTDDKGVSKAVHLDVIEYYRLGKHGRAVSPDSHYSQYWDYRDGDLMITATLTYGMLTSLKRGDTITSKSYVQRSSTNATGKRVVMKTRTMPRRVIPAEHGQRAAFARADGSLATHYRYRVHWDGRRRTKASGAVETGTWWVEVPEQTGPTRARERRQPIPELR